MNGAVSKQMRANTTHENVHIGRDCTGTNVAVHVNSTACEHVVAAFEIIANVMPSITYAISDTASRKEKKRERKKEKNTDQSVFGNNCSEHFFWVDFVIKCVLFRLLMY